MLKNSAIYTFSSVLSAAIPFFLLPILTRYLSPEEYGQIAMFIIFTAAASAIIGLSVHGAANRRFFDENISDFELARFNGNCLYILLSSTSAALICLYFADDFLAKYLDIPKNWFYLGVASVFCSFLLNIRLGQWQIRGKARSYGFFQISNAVIAFLFSLILIIILHLGSEGRIYGIVITGAITGFASYITLRNDKLLLFEYNKQDIKYAMSFGVPLIPHAIGGFLLLTIDRLIINKELGLDMTGIYMVAVSLGSALNIIFTSINKAYSPWLFAKLKENDQEKKIEIVKYTYLYFTFLTLISLPAFYLSPPLLKIFLGEKFQEAANIFPILMLGQVFMGMYFMVTNYIFYVKKTKVLSYVTISSGLINIALLLLLIPSYGIKGAALAFMLACFWQFIFTWIACAKLHDMPWGLRWK